MIRNTSLLYLTAFIVIAASAARADEVILSNGDKLTGKIGQIADGKMKFDSPSLGEITIEMSKIQSFRTDEAADIRLKSGEAPIREKIEEGTPEQLGLPEGRTVPLSGVKSVNPPAQKWTGAVLVAGSLARGNSETEDLNIDAAATLRRDDERHNDRTSFTGDYNFARTGTGDDSTTTTDDWSAAGKYDRFFTEKLYGYATTRVQRDRIADLDIRITPGVGVGYQWIESPGFNFNTEAGVSYVYEEYDDAGSDDFIALRLAYHVDKQLADKLSAFHNVEYLPAFEDFGNFILNADAGLRFDLTKSFFSQFKVQWTHDSEPAPGADKNDYRFLLGVGWQF